jgi:predicted permease
VALLQVITLILGLTLLGAALRLMGLLSPTRAMGLNRIALNVTLPASIFRTLHAFPIVRSALVPPLLTAIITIFLCGVAFGLARMARFPRAMAAVFVLTVVFSNTAFMGFPVVQTLYGDAGLAQAVLLDQLGMEPLAFTLGAVIAANAVEGARIPWKQELAKLARFPPLVTLAAALLWRLLGGPHVPPWPDTLLRWVGAATVPLVMVSLGLVLRLQALRQAWRPAVLIVFLRLIVAPSLGWGASRLAGLTHLQVAITTLELGMPAMMFTFMLALRYQLDAELSAGFITATLLGSAISLPLWAALLG